MPGNHLGIQTTEKRTILVVDDEMVNREILRMMLEGEYHILFAENGQEALDIIGREHESLSVILLDLIMPVISGMIVLRDLKDTPEYSQIPVIVMTADHEAEVASLELGAMDFIPKPYPAQNVVLARMHRIIELSEDQKIIRSTERDPLTGLYNREFFFSYAKIFEQHHKNLSMDAIVLDINRFHIVNERYGRGYADQILKTVADRLRETVQTSGGITCRREADTFLLYCPHREHYEEIMDQISANIDGGEGESSRIRLRMGIYPNVDKTIDMEQRFDRANVAAESVKGNYSRNVAVYDDKLHEAELFSERLAAEFDRAILEKQFRVFYQPKYDIRGEHPYLVSAETLVRWQHPELGMISPGVFIPLFEENGMIQRLDRYVWKEAAEQVRKWKEEYGVSVPVSVNVSRIDFFRHDLVETFEALLSDHQLEPHELMPEITESAYTDNETFIISKVEALRAIGLRVEMDDFGTGYSSLGMISSLPIDALKLDKAFIRSAFSGSGDTRMIELIIDIAGYLGVPVIAEGVETKEQLDVLKQLGCDIVQGYYFSKPVPPEDFAVLIEERAGISLYDRPVPVRSGESLKKKKKTPDRKQPAGTAAEASPENSLTYARLAQALAADYFSIYYVDTVTNRFSEFTAHDAYEDLGIEKEGEDFFNLSRKNILRVVYAEDQRNFLEHFTKENILRKIRENGAFTITYRLMFDGVPNYVSLKATPMGKQDSRHIVVGVNNIHEEMQKKLKSVTYASIAEALAGDYFSIYYVDMDTDRFIEYSSLQEYESLNIEKGGEDFFGLSRKNILRVMYPEDQKKFLEFFTKENLISELDKNGTVTISYRLVFDGNPSWVNMKATRMTDKTDHHIVIGVNNIDTQMKRQEEFEKARTQSMTFSRIAQALSQDYYSIYLVNTVNDEFIEYSSNADYQELNVEKSGSGFFEDCRKNVIRLVHPDDLKKALKVWEKERLLSEIDDGKTFSVTYRLMFDKKPSYINCKVIRMIGDDEPYIVIGVSNVDDQMRRELLEV